MHVKSPNAARQGLHTGSLWMPPLGDYLIGNSPAAARATINKTTLEKYTHFAGNFYCHRDAAVYDIARIAR